MKARRHIGSIRCCLILLASMVSLAACSPGARTPLGPTATLTAVPTQLPTITSTPMPTRTPTPTRGPGLDTLVGTPLALAAAADLEGAQSAYNDLAALYPGRAEPLLGLSSIAQRQGNWGAALDYLQRAVEVDPSNQEALRQWALLLEQQGDYASLVKVHGQMLQLLPDDPDLLVARAMAEARLGQSQAAVDDLRAAQRLDPYREYAWINVAGAASGARRYEPAITIASAGLEASPGAVGLLMERGLAYLSLSQTEAAIKDFDAVIAADGSHYEAYHWRGRALVSSGRYDEAIADLEQAADLGARSGASGVNQAYESMAYAADAMARTDVNAAFTYLKEKVFQYGSRDALLLGYGLVRWRQGSIQLALDYLDSLVEADYVPALYWRGSLYTEQGQTVDAVADLREFLSIRRFGPDVESARALLVSLGEDPGEK